MEIKVQPPVPRAAPCLVTLCLLTMVFALAACGDEPSDAGSRPGGAARKSSQPVDDATRGMVSGVTDAHKAGAPVDLKFELKARPTLGEPLPIDIAMIPREPSELLRVTFLSNDERLAVAPSPVPAEYRNVEAQSVYRHTINVMPREEGVFYLNAFVVMNMTNGAEVRTFQIPVLVGAPRDASEAMKSHPTNNGGTAPSGGSDPDAS